MMQPSADTPVSTLTDDLGRRIAAYRLSRNLRQEDLARETGLSRATIIRLETGRGTLDSLIRVMKALDLEDRLAGLLPDAGVSPLDRRSDVAARRRARPRTHPGPGEGKPWSWGDT